MNKNPKRIDFARRFDKQLRRAPLDVEKAFQKRFEIFLKDSFHPLLNNHQLTGKFKGYRSINITGDWRAIFKEKNDLIVFYVLGTHSQLYK